LNTKPKVKGENKCYRDKKFKDGVTKLGKKTVLIENDLEKMEIFLKQKFNPVFYVLSASPP